jgi:hypothetical protein
MLSIMVIRLTIVCVRYNVTMEILCHKDTECIVSDETIEIKATSDKVRNKIKDFCKFARISIKEYPIIHKLVIPRESKKVFAKTFDNR